MKKKLIIVFLFIVILVILKFHYSNYKLEYKINNYNVISTYKNNKYYFEIFNDNKYNFDIYDKRKYSKLYIEDIKEIVFDNYTCIVPIISDYKTYPLCSNGDINVDYNLIDSDFLYDYKQINENKKTNNDFEYYNNLDDNTYIALWNYKGYIIMNGQNYENVNIISNEKYDNDLSYQLNEYIYMPNYDQSYEFNELIKLNIVSKKIEKIQLDYNIDYDSYVVGNLDNYIYIFDNKYNILYSFNLDNNKLSIVGNSELGYTKYENNDFVSCSRNDYKLKKVNYTSIVNYYNYIKDEKNLFKISDENNNIKTLILNNNPTIIYNYKNDLYYTSDDSLYKYNPYTGSEKIFYNYELTFNNENSIFVFIK